MEELADPWMYAVNDSGGFAPGEYKTSCNERLIQYPAIE